VEYFHETVITHDTNLILCHNVTTIGTTINSWMISSRTELLPGIIYGNVSLLELILAQYHAIEDNRTTMNELIEYQSETTVIHDTELILCHELKTTNIINASWMISTTTELKNGIIHGNRTLLESLFRQYHANENGEEIFDSTKATHDMDLTLYHIINSQGELNGTWNVPSDNMNLTEVVKEIARFFKSDSYVIGDLNTSGIIEEDFTVVKDVYIVVMDPTSIEIVLKDEQTTFNSSEIADDICNNLGMCDESVIIQAVKNNDDNVVKIIVMVKDETVANDFVVSINTAAESCVVNSSSSQISSSSSNEESE